MENREQNRQKDGKMNKSEKRADKQYQIIDGNKRRQPTAELMVVLADKMDIHTIGVYYELVAHSGMYGSSLSQRQIAKALRIGLYKVGKALKALEELGVIEIDNSKTNMNKADTITLKDVDRAWELNPKGKEYSRTWRWA